MCWGLGRHHVKITHSGNSRQVSTDQESLPEGYGVRVLSNLQQRKSLAQLLVAQPSGELRRPPPLCRSPGGAPAQDGGGRVCGSEARLVLPQQAQQSSHETGEPINWLILLIMFGHCLAGPAVSWVVFTRAHLENWPGLELFVNGLMSSSNGPNLR